MLILYNPPSCNPAKIPLPMSLLALAAVLEDRIPFKIVDGNLLKNPIREMETVIRDCGATALGITVMPGPQLNEAVPFSKKMKRLFPGLPIIWGGYFPTQHSEVCLQSGYVDYVVRGQGEFTLIELLERLQSGGDLTTVRGLSFRQDDAIINNEPRPLTPLTELPRFPYRRVAMEHYIRHNYIADRTTDHNSSFGCPFACNFCAIVSMTHQRWLPQSAENLAETFRELKEDYGVNGVLFHDMDFFISEPRVVEFCERIRKMDMAWWALGRMDEMARYSHKSWRLLKESGLKMLYCGAETGSDEMLKRMNKGGQASTEKTIEVALKMKEYGITPEFSFVLGNPPEPERDAEITFRFIRKLKRLNPAIELILYTYSPVPSDAGSGDLYSMATAAGFQFPNSLEEWVEEPWRSFALRREPNTPWLDRRMYRKIRNFERVINAYYPTTTDLRIRGLKRKLLRTLGGWRYLLKFYQFPLELRLLQRAFAYQRPETSGF